MGKVAAGSLLALWAAGAVAATSAIESFFGSQGSAVNACTAQAPVSECSTNGASYSSACSNNPTPYGNGMYRVTRVEQFKGPGGSCAAGLDTRYTYFIWRTSSCPSGTTFVGPAATDCVSTVYAQQAASNTKGCGAGSGLGGDECSAGRQEGDGQELVGNPINAAIGNKVQREVDIEGSRSVPGLVRTYNSLDTRDGAGLGVGWTHNWAMRLEQVGSTVTVVREDGSRFAFTGSGYGVWSGEADSKARLESFVDRWELKRQDGSTETYNRAGQLVRVEGPDLMPTVLSYSNGPLTTVTGPYGHKLIFTWTGSTLVSVKDAAGEIVSFTVSAARNLTKVAYPDGTNRQYLYEAALLPHGLTGIVDGTGTRTSTYTYDNVTMLAKRTERAGGVGAFEVSFSGLIGYITDAVGRVVTKVRDRILGLSRPSSVSNSSDAKTASTVYDASGNAISVTNEEGQVTTSSYDTANRLVSRTRAAGTALAQTTMISYANSFVAVPAQVTEPSVYGGGNKVTSFGYSDPVRTLLPTSITVSGFTPAGVPVSRSFSMLYDGNGRLSVLDGPRVDVVDKTTVEYWDCTTGGACGQPRRVTNGLGQAETYDSYDAAGRLTQKTAIDGVTTSYAYDKRGRTISVTETGGTVSRSATFSYDGAGRLKTAALPTGRVLTYSYDAADQLLSVVDQLGNKVEYGYDLKGNRTAAAIRNPAGQVEIQVGWSFDARNYLSAMTAGGGTMPMLNDALGNRVQVTDANGNLRLNQFDALNRLWKTTDAAGGVTTASFAPAGDLVQLVTPNGAGFGYVVDDLGNVLQEQSPDRGMTTMTYDAAGNMISRTDARGVTKSMGYDVLGRLVQVSYTPGSLTESYTYDSCRPGKLCSVTDAGGTKSFQYDGLGRRSQEVWTSSAALGGLTYTTSYTWTGFDQVQSMVYPSGRTVTYGFDAIGRLSSMSSSGVAVVTSRTYRADGQVAGQVLANGLSESRSFDTAGRLTGWSVPGIESRTYSRDLNGNVTSISWGGTTRNYGYDVLDRITSEPGQALSWDGNGNRTADASGVYTYQPNSNRSSTTPAGAVSFDAAGNIIAVGNRAMVYDEAGRLAHVWVAGSLAGTYVHRDDGLRAGKTTSSGTMLFHWDREGRLLEETTPTGAVVRSYAWMEQVPVAQWTGPWPTVPAYLHTDHLGTPRIATTAAGTVVWRWDSDAFGAAAPTGSVTVNLRFPGQYFDAESGMHENWHRTYDPGMGRYTQSDPIGLAGGINTYSYVGGNPISYVDPDGRLPLPIVTGLIGAGAGAIGNLVGQVAVNKCKPFSLTDFLVATGGGFISGAAAPFVPGGVLGVSAWGGVSNVGQYAAGSAIKGESMSWTGAGTNFATGVVGGAVGGAVGRASPWPYAGTAASREMVDSSNNAASVRLNTGISNFLRNLGGGVVGNAPVTDMCECMAK